LRIFIPEVIGDVHADQLLDMVAYMVVGVVDIRAIEIDLGQLIAGVVDVATDV
jgi:hypothetical protein